MYYNADLFRAAKVTPPAADAAYTWDEFLAAARSLTRRDGEQVLQYGYVPEIWWGMWAIWAWANGAPHAAQARALLAGYYKLRRLPPEDRAALSTEVRAAAARFTPSTSSSSRMWRGASPSSRSWTVTL